MHKIKMLTTQMGVHDGELHPVALIEGGVYHVGPDLLQGLINLGAIELVDADADEPTGTPVDHRETKVDGPAETKPAGPASRKKK